MTLLRTLCLSVAVICAASAADRETSLAGRWRFALDRNDAGMAQRWFEQRLAGSIKLPGSLPQQGIGDKPSVATKWTGGIQEKDWFFNPLYAPYAASNDFHFPFWLQPETYYVGAAWFQREIRVPKEWAGQRIVLSLERPHWETRMWVDGVARGSNDSLGTPHEYDLGVLPAGKHTLTVRVDNRMVVDVGHDSHSVTDHTQGNWNGIVGRITMRPASQVWISDLQVYPSVATSTVLVRGTIGNAAEAPGQGTVEVTVTPKDQKRGAPLWKRVPVGWQQTGGVFQCEIAVPDRKVWDEFTPNLYVASAALEQTRAGNSDAKSVTFGFRELGTQGTQFVLNGRKTFFRGTLECAIFPKTGHPPTDVDSWKRIIRIAKAHGLNLIRFHSWCPPEAAFEAADELGFYYQVEVSSWANASTTLGDGKPVDAWLYTEATRMLREYGNHPSFLLMPYGNEPGGKNHSAYLAKWVEHWKQADTRRLFTSGSGWPQIPENQFHVTPDPRIQAWGGGLKSRINARPPATVTDYREYISKRTVPVISHEIGQWCVYPNFSEMRKYTGYLKPRNFEIFRDTLRKHGMSDQARDFLYASGRLQTLCYKEDIESALRTPGMGGFQLLDLHDFPGQGTALVGVLDPFWDEKGYVTPAEYSRFCGPTVPLARLAKRVFTTEENLEAAMEVAHFGAATLKNAATHWRLVAEKGETIAQGTFAARDVPVDNGTPLGTVRIPLSGVRAPAHLKLVVTLEDERNGKRGKVFENDWDVWVYSPTVSTAASRELTVTHELDEAALAKLSSGGKVLLLVPPARVTPDPRLGKVALGFSSIFWNTAWTHRQAPHTLGVLCEPKHPLFGSFPTDCCSDWQWWYLISRAGAMILDSLPREVRPQVQVIDDWVTNRRLGVYFEAAVNGGKLAVCSIDLESGLATNVVARQFRHSLLEYMSGESFRPKAKATVEQIRSVYGAASAMQMVGAKASASSNEAGYETENAIDGDPNTMWHSEYTSRRAGFPHELRVEFVQPLEMVGFKMTPRQDHNRNGWIKSYAFYASVDGHSWSEPVAKGEFSRDATVKTIRFAQSVRGKFVKLVALSGFDSQPYAAVAELELIPAASGETARAAVKATH